MADRAKIMLRLALLGLILLTAAAGSAMLAAPQEVRDMLALDQAGQSQAESDPQDNVLPAEDLLADAGLEVPAKQVELYSQQWRQMDGVDRRRMQRHYESLQWLSASARAELVERYNQTRHLPAEQRDTMRQQAEMLADFEATLGREDLAMIDSMPPAERARSLLALWRESQGLQ